jgi:hypothetical protein
MMELSDIRDKQEGAYDFEAGDDVPQLLTVGSILSCRTHDSHSVDLGTIACSRSLRFDQCMK